jgi:hypothetical protein
MIFKDNSRLIDSPSSDSDFSMTPLTGMIYILFLRKKQKYCGAKKSAKFGIFSKEINRI